MRAPAVLAAWLLAFAVAASAGAFGGALLLDRGVQRERAGAAAQGEMDAFLDGKLARQAGGPEAPAIMKGLAGSVASHDGPAAEVARFRAQSAGDRRIFLYRRGDQVTGSGRAWPPARPYRHGLVRYDDGGREVVAAVHRFPGGDELLIGRRVERVDPLSGPVLRVGALTLAALLAAGAAVAFVFARSHEARLRAVTGALEKVEAGEMTARAPGAERGDEFGVMARHVNRMLDRVGRYVEGMRNVSDEIAHDLRTPLNRIQTRLAAVEARAPGDPDLALAAHDLRGLSKIIDDFLWLREVEAGVGGEAAFIDLADLAREVAEDHALIAADAKQIDLTVEGETAEAVGFRSLLVRALDNLIGNAVKFTPEGGTIRVRAERQDGHARLVVEDSGPGMDDDLLARAVQPGVRGATDQPGHGLGLAIAASVARRHGGELVLTNRAEGGLRACLVLPASNVRPV